MSAFPNLCHYCVHYIPNEKLCTRFIVNFADKNKINYEEATSVRNDVHRCGPSAKLFVSKIIPHIIIKNVQIQK